MNISQVGVNLIKSTEGLELEAYKATKNERYYTIGYGHYGVDVKADQKITTAQAETMLKNDLKHYVDSVNRMLTHSVNQNQFDALVSFSYNCGVGALESSTLLKLVNKGDFIGASKEFDKWVHQAGEVLPGLVTRRKAEKALFLKSVGEVKQIVKFVVLKKGSKGERVEQAQRALNIALGKKVTDVDGLFGSDTEKEVKDYQKRHGLVADGIIGEKTWNMMF